MLQLGRYFVVVLFVLSLAACASETAPPPTFVTTPVAGSPVFGQPSAEGGYPAPTVSGSSGYPEPSAATTQSSDGRSQTALVSYRLAEDAAKKLEPQAQLHSIFPSQIMLNNLAGPPVLPGWFYVFKVPGMRRQFIVQVVDDKVTGTTQAEPIEEPKPVEKPINIADIKLDSSQVFEQFKAAMQKQGTPTDDLQFDLELVNLENQSGPVWSVVDPRTLKWVYSVNASTGEELSPIRQ